MFTLLIVIVLILIIVCLLCIASEKEDNGWTALLAVFLTVIVTCAITTRIIRNDAIDFGVGKYNEKGDFQWK